MIASYLAKLLFTVKLVLYTQQGMPLWNDATYCG